MQGTFEERFWAKVDKSGDCWLWTGGTNGKYGCAYTDKTMIYAHRASYTFAHGPIPEGLQVDHICHVKLCVNPSHLRLATNKQNNENKAGAQANNKAGYRGVHWDKKAKRWAAQVQHHGEHYWCGYHSTAEEAAAAAQARRLEFFTHNTLDRVPA